MQSAPVKTIALITMILIGVTIVASEHALRGEQPPKDISTRKPIFPQTIDTQNPSRINQERISFDPNWLIAADPRAGIQERIAAAGRLNESDRQRLRAALSRQIPGHWDEAALDTINVLSEIVDVDTDQLFDTLLHSPQVNVPDKISTALYLHRRVKQHIRAPDAGRLDILPASRNQWTHLTQLTLDPL